MAAEVLEARAGDPIWWLLQRCHVQLRETRGATMTLAQIRSEDGTLTWGGIGNVEGSLVRASLTKRRREATRRLPGAVGFILPQFQPAATRLAPGDVVVLATNGIAPRFADDVSLLGDPTAIAQRILRRHRRHDEALVLAVRFLGT